MEKKNYTTEEQKADNTQGTGILPCVSEPLLWKDILDDFYVEHDKQISNGEYAGKMILVFRDWLEKNYQVPKRIKSGDKRTKPLTENREAEAYYDNDQLKSRTNHENDKLNGLRETWYENGQLGSRANYENDKLNGLYETWYENGQLKSRSNFKNDKLNGLWESWYENGQIKSRTNYKNGKPNGLHEAWYENGQLRESTTYKNDIKQPKLKSKWF